MYNRRVKFALRIPDRLGKMPGNLMGFFDSHCTARSAGAGDRKSLSDRRNKIGIKRQTETDRDVPPYCTSRIGELTKLATGD